MGYTKEQLEVIKQFEAEQEAQLEEKKKTKIFFSFYVDDLI